MKSKDLNKIGIIFSPSEIIDQISSHINGLPEIETSFRNYRGTIENYAEMKGKHFFEDEVSSKVNAFAIEDIKSNRMIKNRKDMIGSKTTWKAEDNVTSIILPDEIMPNNVSSYINSKAKFNNVTSRLKIFY